MRSSARGSKGEFVRVLFLVIACGIKRVGSRALVACDSWWARNLGPATAGALQIEGGLVILGISANEGFEDCSAL